ncbi:MAG: elongation factor 4 [Verrucomicrobia bacterium]|nr:elongation factor 4 [Verrucomicrobiota bacterium]
MDRSHIRNFCIIAHIDHGKSTLADRFLELTHTIAQREMQAQVLDNMDLERERGITIKAHPVRMVYPAADGATYELNLIDTPGHVDFTYEVSRSLAACEGALLVIDAAQGIEAQTIANLHLALERGLEIIPVINKIDLPSADVAGVLKQIEEIIAIPAEEALACSAKTGDGVAPILEAVVERIPPPRSDADEVLKALIFDCTFDAYRGAVSYVRVFSGRIARGTTMRMMSSGRTFPVSEVGVFRPAMTPIEALEPGDVGYIVAGIKEAVLVRIGDTITDEAHPAEAALPGFRDVRPMVFSGLYPIEASDYEQLKDALERLRLNDASFIYEPESSVALGFGFRCGFLGLLHLEIIFERIEREFGIATISTTPSVIYRILKTDGTLVEVDNPIHWPDPAVIGAVEEPYITASVIVPNEHIGAVMQLGLERRGECVATESLDSRRVLLTFEFPLSEIIVDYYDKLKSVTRGYGSLDWELLEYRPGDMVRVDILLNGDPVDAFSMIVHRDRADFRSRAICKKLREVIPRQQFRVAIQAAIGARIIARETVSAVRKDVTAKCYGGDITRKRKLLEKQKAGKKRMKQIGMVSLPQSAFVEVLKATD